jgi:hypothetical protein
MHSMLAPPDAFVNSRLFLLNSDFLKFGFPFLVVKSLRLVAHPQLQCAPPAALHSPNFCKRNPV